MIYRHDISFKSGEILTADMLKLLYDYPRKLAGISLAAKFDVNVSDGILFGFVPVKDEDEDLYFTPGLLRWKGQLYFMDEPLSAKEIITQFRNLSGNVKIVLVDDESDERGSISTAKMKAILERESSHNSGIVLGGFNLQKGRTVRVPCVRINSSTDPFKEFHQFGDRLDLVHVPYIWREGLTYHPLLFNAMREVLSKKAGRDVYDDLLLMELSNGSAVSLETLNVYIHGKDSSLSPIEDRDQLFDKVTELILTGKTSTQKVEPVHSRIRKGGSI